MEIRNLITFTKVAETQSLSKAARLLGYAQSTVTMQMQQLEQELGAQLYERVGKQIRITQTGQEFLSYAAAIVRMSEDALKVGKQDTSAITGSLRLGISGQLSCERLSSRIARYLQDYPQVDVNVQVIAEPEELLFRLRHNDIDLALTLDLLRTDTDLIHAAKDLPAPLHAFAAKEKNFLIIRSSAPVILKPVLTINCMHPVPGRSGFLILPWHFPSLLTAAELPDQPPSFWSRILLSGSIRPLKSWSGWIMSLPQAPSGSRFSATGINGLPEP